MVHGDPAQIYADTPDKVAPVEHTALGAALLKSVQSSGFASDEYVPKPRQLPEREVRCIIPPTHTPPPQRSAQFAHRRSPVSPALAFVGKTPLSRPCTPASLVSFL